MNKIQTRCNRAGSIIVEKAIQKIPIFFFRLPHPTPSTTPLPHIFHPPLSYQPKTKPFPKENMSTSHPIPRARARFPRGSPATPNTEDAIVQQTDQDASGSRLSAVEAGYLDDPFAGVFVASSSGQGRKRFPIINRGKNVVLFFFLGN